jgi:N-acetylglucosamine malate deacetylase 1
MKPISRRHLLGQSLGVAGAFAAGLPLADGARDDPSVSERRKLKVMVVGGHPDDPESGCGGTMALYADRSDEVVALYLTRGEAGINGKTHQQAAAIRTQEAQQACQILKARPVFAGQIDGATEVNQERYSGFRQLLEAERPDIVFTHWPVDMHPDHRAASLLTYDAWLRMGRKFALYYFEVLTGEQTQNFSPSHYVDITSTEARKRAACYAHASQNPDEFYAYHDQMNRFRGMECAAKYAEAFIAHVQSSVAVPQAAA